MPMNTPDFQVVPRRITRLQELRQWGTTDHAEKTALAIITALPDRTGQIGIFPTGLGEDDETGDGGIHFQRFTTTSSILVRVNADGSIGECSQMTDDEYSEADLRDPAAAASYLAMEES